MLVAKGLTTSNKKLLGAPGITTRSMDAPGLTTSNKKLLVAILRALLLVTRALLTSIKKLVANKRINRRMWPTRNTQRTGQWLNFTFLCMNACDDCLTAGVALSYIVGKTAVFIC